MHSSNWFALVGHLEERRKEAAKSKKHITELRRIEDRRSASPWIISGNYD
jgi:hypothetical protein